MKSLKDSPNIRSLKERRSPFFLGALWGILSFIPILALFGGEDVSPIQEENPPQKSIISSYFLSPALNYQNDLAFFKGFTDRGDWTRAKVEANRFLNVLASQDKDSSSRVFSSDLRWQIESALLYWEKNFLLFEPDNQEAENSQIKPLKLRLAEDEKLSPESLPFTLDDERLAQALARGESPFPYFYALYGIQGQTSLISRFAEENKKNKEGEKNSVLTLFRQNFKEAEKLRDLLEKFAKNSETSGRFHPQIHRLFCELLAEESRILRECSKTAQNPSSREKFLTAALTLLKQGKKDAESLEEKRLLFQDQLETLRLLNRADDFKMLARQGLQADSSLEIRTFITAETIRLGIQTPDSPEFTEALRLARTGEDLTGEIIRFPQNIATIQEREIFCRYQTARLEILGKTDNNDEEKSEDEKLAAALVETLNRPENPHIWRNEALRLAESGAGDWRTLLNTAETAIQSGRLQDAFDRLKKGAKREMERGNQEGAFRLAGRAAGILEEILQKELYRSPDSNQLSGLAKEIQGEFSAASVNLPTVPPALCESRIFWLLAAQNRFEELSRQFPQNPLTESFSLLSLNYGEELNRAGQISDADYAEKLREHTARFAPNGGDAEIFAERFNAERLYRLGQKQEAVDILAQILKKSPDNPDALYLLAEILTQEENQAAWKKGLAIVRRLSNAFPEGSEKWINVCRWKILLSARLGNVQEAKREAELLKIAYPESFKALETEFRDASMGILSEK